MNNLIYDNRNEIITNESNEKTLDEFIKEYKFIDSSNNEDVFFNITHKEELKRVNSCDNLKEEIKSIKNSFQNIFTTSIKKNDVGEYNNVMFLNVNKPLLSGEHLRVVDTNNKKVYEVILGKVNKKRYSSVEIYYEYENHSSLNYNQNIKIYRNIAPGFNTDEEYVLFNCNTEDEVIKKQIEFIKKSFNSILPERDFKITISENNVNIFSNIKGLKFERVSGNILYNYDTNKNVDVTNEKKDITYFGIEIPNVILKPSISTTEDNFILQPINFEAWNNRSAYIINFLSFDSNVSLFDLPKQYYKEIKNDSYIFYNNDYKKNKTFTLVYCSDVEENGEEEIQCNALLSNNIDNYLIQIANDEGVENLKNISFYTPIQIELNIASILGIKDFNFNVLQKGTVNADSDEFILNGEDNYDKEISNNDISFAAIRKESDSCETLEHYFNLLLDTSNNSDVSINKYYNTKRKMDIPLVTPINCKWELTGKDYTNNNIKSTFFHDTIEKNSYRLNDDSSLFGFISGMDIDDEFYIKEDFHSYKENILNGTGNIFQFINDSNKFTKIKYNSNLKVAECIFFGKKIQISASKIDLSQFNNYLFTVVRVSNSGVNSTPIEFIFDKKNKVLLCVWYFNNNENTQNDIKSSIINATFSINNESYIDVIFNDGNSIAKDTSLFLSFLSNKSYYIYNEENLTCELKSSYENNKLDSENEKYIVSTELNDTINLLSDKLTKTKNKGICYILGNNENLLNEDYSIKTFIKTLNNNNINYYIVEENKNQKGIDKFLVSIIEPKNIKESLLKTQDTSFYVYSGYIEPEIINMVEFESNSKIKINEEENKEYIFDNLIIKNVYPIKQLWYNKVFDSSYIYNSENKENDIKGFSIQVLNDVDITNNCWDDNFYKKYDSNFECDNVNGYASNKDTKSFFGSHCINIKRKEIELNNWSDNYEVKNITKDYNNYDDLKNKNIISLNISNALKKFIQNETSFLDNWSFKQDAMKYNEDYLNNLLTNFYSINNKNVIKVYKRKKVGNNILVKYNNDNSFEEVKNVNIDLNKKENDYILDLILPIDEYEYAIKYTICK